MLYIVITRFKFISLFGDNMNLTLKYISEIYFTLVQAEIRSNYEKNYYLMCNNDHFFNS